MYSTTSDHKQNIQIKNSLSIAAQLTLNIYTQGMEFISSRLMLHLYSTHLTNKHFKVTLCNWVLHVLAFCFISIIDIGFQHFICCLGTIVRYNIVTDNIF